MGCARTLILTAEFDPHVMRRGICAPFTAAGNEVEQHRIKGIALFFALGIKFLHVQGAF